MLPGTVLLLFPKKKEINQTARALLQNDVAKDHGGEKLSQLLFLLFPGAVPILIHLTKIIAQELNFAYIREQN